MGSEHLAEPTESSAQRELPSWASEKIVPGHNLTLNLTSHKQDPREAGH